MKYIAILRQQGEGCDYTIGCGVNTIEFEAESPIMAALKLKDIIRENYYGNSESVLKSAIFYEINASYSVDLERWYDEFYQLQLKEEQNAIVQRELHELERLKQKYEK